MYHKDLEKGADSPTTSTDGSNEVISPMVELQTPNTTVKLLSPSNRASSANGSDRLTIAIKKDSLKKRCKRFASMLMAVLLFGGGLVSVFSVLTRALDCHLTMPTCHIFCYTCPRHYSYLAPSFIP